jgi:hypothetical protein
VNVDHSRPLHIDKSSSSTQAPKTPAASAPKIIGKFKPLLLAEVHAAGNSVSKEIRDRLQNHTLQDVSSKNYDRWNYMPEKRAGMEKWDAFVRTLLSKKTLTIAA